jgi:hypothetical protein
MKVKVKYTGGLYMRKQNTLIIIIFLVVGTLVLASAITMLFFGEALAARFDVIGIRVATLFVAFSSFLSSMIFSLLILMHNKTVVKYNDDTNRRAELFREQQFASSNYSIIEFMDRMLIYPESTRYIDRLVVRKSMLFHMIEQSINEQDVLKKPEDFLFFSLKIPYRITEGKIVSSITFDRLKFERNGNTYEFITPKPEQTSRTFLLYNEHTKRNNVIINLIVKKDADFFNKASINLFSKIKISINITSILGVLVKGVSELYFTNPEQIEGDGSNTYKINSANFTLTEMPSIVKS